MAKFIRGTLDKRFFNRLMKHKKTLRDMGIPEKELTLPALQRFDNKLVAVKYRLIIPNKRNLLKILRGEGV